MKTTIFLSLLIVLLFTACKKDSDTTDPSVPPYTHQDLSAYSYFKKGTYWIYKDSTSGVEDSVYVYADTSYMYHRTETVQADGNYMYYNCHAHSFYDTYNYYYHIDIGNYILSTKEIGVVRIRVKPGDYVGETYLMSNRFVIDDVISWYSGTGITYYKTFYETLNLQGVNYVNVSKFYDTQNLTEYESPTFFYIAKNIGIIRKEKTDSNIVWNLIRYHIIQ